jgi:hypothetical protein
MSEPTDHTLALLRRMDAKLDRLQSDVTDLRGRLQRVEGRVTSLDARLGVLETFDGEVTRLDRRPVGHGRRHGLTTSLSWSSRLLSEGADGWD